MEENNQFSQGDNIEQNNLSYNQVPQGAIGEQQTFNQPSIVNQEPVQQVNYFDSTGVGGITTNIESPKKQMNLLPIIIGVIIVGVIAIVLIFVLPSINKKKDSNINNNSNGNNINDSANNNGKSNENSNIIKPGEVVSIVMNDESVTMIDANGYLYTIGESRMTENMNDVNNIKLLLKDIKYINNYSSGITSSIYIINDKNELYNYGISYSGANYGYKTRIYENVANVYGNGILNVLTTTNGDFYVFDSPSSSIASLKQRKNAFTKIGNNAKIPFTTYSSFCGYIGNDGSLYKTYDGENTEKLLDNVKGLSKWNYTIIIITNNNEVYTLEDEDDNSLKLLDQNVKTIGDYYYITNNDELKYYLYEKVKLSGIEQLYYIDSIEDNIRYVYLNNNNKIVLKDNNNVKELDKKVENMGTILNFIKTGSMEDIQTKIDNMLVEDNTSNSQDTNGFIEYHYDTNAFLLQIGDVYTKNGEVQVNGTIKFGTINVGDEVIIKGLNTNFKTKVTNMYEFLKEITSASAGNTGNIALVLSDVTIDQIKENQIVTTSDNIKTFKRFTANIIMNGNASSNINDGDTLKISFWGAYIDATIHLNNKSSISANESALVTIELSDDIAIESGGDFRIYPSISSSLLAQGNILLVSEN